MFRLFSRTFITIALLGASVSLAVGQDADAILPDQEVAIAVVGTVPSTDALIGTCTPHLPVQENVCVLPTQTYLDELAAQNVPAGEYSQALADLVVQLVPLPPTGEDCGVIPSEVPESIRLVATQATDPDQAAGFVEIASTLESCTDFQTAAIVPQASPN